MANTSGQKAVITRAKFKMKMTNIALSILLRSPFHRKAGESLLLLTFRGRKSGKKYSFPVGYIAEDQDNLVILTPKKRTWWKNFRDESVGVTVYVQGNKRQGIGEAVSDDSRAIIEGIRAFLRSNPKAAPMYRVELDTEGKPTLETLQQAVPHWIAVRLHLKG